MNSHSEVELLRLWTGSNCRKYNGPLLIQYVWPIYLFEYLKGPRKIAQGTSGAKTGTVSKNFCVG